MTSADARTFLGFEAPFLHGLARALLGAEFRDRLADVVVVLPGRRAGRRLLERLALESDGVFEPPRIVTETGLAQALSAKELAIASAAAVEFAWLEVISAASPGELALFAPSVPAAEHAVSRLGLARQLAALDRERVSDQLLSSDPRFADDSEARLRIEGIARISGEVERTLERAGLVDPNRALERVSSASARREGLQVVLAGVVEWSAAQRSFLSSLSPPPRVFIQAGRDCAAGFDELGALLPNFWAQREIPLRDEDWCAVDAPRSAVAESVAWMSKLPQGTRVDQIALGVLGAELVPGLQHAVEESGHFLHVAAGWKAKFSAPWRALSALKEWLLRKDFSALAALVRHADVESAIRAELPPEFAQHDPARDLDSWHAENLPESLTGELCGKSKLTEPARSYRDGALRLCGDLASDEKRPLRDWLTPLGQLVCRIYPELPGEENSAAHRTRGALQLLADVAADVGSFCARGFDRPISSISALELWLEWSGERELPPATRASEFEALGWLELSMEDAPYLLLLGLNDGWLPQVERLPRLVPRTPDERGARTRYARDVHGLSAVATVRAKQGAGLRAVTLRHALTGDPLRPSRLLFHCDDATAIARAERFFATASQAPRNAGESEQDTRSTQAIMPVPNEPVWSSMRVTGFKAFLESPYLFYLQQACKLERVRDDAWELDARAFGNLAHDVLRDWGRSEARDSTDETRIANFVVDRLRELGRERFGMKPLPAVRLQLQQLERRLAAFARAQAEQARSGWRVSDVEFPLVNAELVVDGTPIAIHGKVDRLDQHANSKAWRVLDYKTGAGSDDPTKEHRQKSGAWKDLQLPLYRHFLQERLQSTEIELGYFALPAALERSGVILANFTDADLDEAVEVARTIVRMVRAGEFRELGRGKPVDRVQRALCGVSLLTPPDEFDFAPSDGDGESEEEGDSA